jgi:hypothetical protein
MNNEEQKEYQEHFSPDGERLQYLMEHPEENESEQIREIARDLHCNIISVNDGVSAINLLLAKQQADFVKCIPEERKYDPNTKHLYFIHPSAVDGYNQCIADIKSKLIK